MNDIFFPSSAETLATQLAREFDANRTIFGIPQEVFAGPGRPKLDLSSRHMGRSLEAPLGVAAGPHTQLAQNIISSYLTGARFIELKTVQILDDIEVEKPCIDMRDVGFNCEWSQELNLERSFEQYAAAFVLCRALAPALGFSPEGFSFNMSVGYDLKGIKSDRINRFISSMRSSRAELERLTLGVRDAFKGTALERALHDIPEEISSSVTLSTMHGCPPDEIARIGRHLIEGLGLHTTIKLNPTLLGAERLREILHDRLGHDDIEVPDEAFDHDPDFAEAVDIIESLRSSAQKAGVELGLKLTNTLETKNTKKFLPESQPLHYMSGRPLHPLAVELSRLLAERFGFEVPISLSGGADAFNVADVLACGIRPVTASSDLLRPGGYGRLSQYWQAIAGAMEETKAADLDALTVLRAVSTPKALRRTLTKFEKLTSDACAAAQFGSRVSQLVATSKPITSEGILQALQVEGSNERLLRACRLSNLEAYAAQAVSDERYAKAQVQTSLKNTRPLELTDCAIAPCRDGCPANQDIPSYLHLAAEGEYDAALEVILRDNPLAAITGDVCHHPCTSLCVRGAYDAPLDIRGVKRLVVENASEPRLEPKPATGISVGIVGAGPAGLAAAFFAWLDGHDVAIYEARDEIGGIPASAIPDHRLRREALERDLRRLEALGVEIHCGRRLGDNLSLESLRQLHRYVFLATGAGKGRRLGVSGEAGPGVFDAIELLEAIKAEAPPHLGPKVLVVGGGNSAMDAARAARRLVGKGGRVTVVYRRTRGQMPASTEEIEAALDEGVVLEELWGPMGVMRGAQGEVLGLACVQMELGPEDRSGRRRPVPVEGTEKVFPAETIIAAVGQGRKDGGALFEGLPTTADGRIAAEPGGNIGTKGVFAGGDAVRGAASVIEAEADAREAIRYIAFLEGLAKDPEPSNDETPDGRELLVRKYRRNPPTSPQNEASRCLGCDDLCALCVTVCPNRANILYELEPVYIDAPVYRMEENSARLLPQTNRLEVKQRHQVANIKDWCNACGNCAAFCPSAGAPFRDKPRIALSAEIKTDSPDETLFKLGAGGRWTILSGDIELTWSGDFFELKTQAAGARFSPTFEVQRISATKQSTDSAVLDLFVPFKLALIGRALHRTLSESGYM